MIALLINIAKDHTAENSDLCNSSITYFQMIYNNLQ